MQRLGRWPKCRLCCSLPAAPTVFLNGAVKTRARRKRGAQQAGKRGAICSSGSGWCGWTERAAAERRCPVSPACRNLPRNDKTGLSLQTSSAIPRPAQLAKNRKISQAKPNRISFCFPSWHRFPNGHSDRCGEQPSSFPALPVTTGL